MGGDLVIAARLGISAETLGTGVGRAEVDDGLRPGLASDERERRQAWRENRELGWASEILERAAALFAATLDRRPPR